RSVRCCASSSMTSASRSGESPRPESFAEISDRQSRMLTSRDAAHRSDEALPGGSLIGEHSAALRRQPIEPSPAFAGAFDPPTLNPAAPFQAIQQRVQRGDLEANSALGSLFDELAELIAVPGPVLDQREDEQLGASLLQFTIEA